MVSSYDELLSTGELTVTSVVLKLIKYKTGEYFFSVLSQKPVKKLSQGCTNVTEQVK